MQLTIKTDHKWRETLYRYDLPDRVLVTEFDYQDAEEVGDGYPNHRGRWHYMDRLYRDPNPFLAWLGWLPQ